MTIQEKITSAFKELRKLGYFARQNFWCCQTCGWSAVPEKKADKAVFYHAQDKSDLDERGYCYLAWAGDGAEIVKTLEKHGLIISWNGQETTRIRITSN